MWWKQQPLVEEGKEEAATADRSEEGKEEAVTADRNEERKEEEIEREGCQRSQGLSGDLSWIFILHSLMEHIQQSILTVHRGFFPNRKLFLASRALMLDMQ